MLTCEDCNALQCMFLQYTVRNAKGSRKENTTILDKFAEDNGYRCGDSVCFYANGEIKAPNMKDDEEEEWP